MNKKKIFLSCLIVFICQINTLIFSQNQTNYDGPNVLMPEPSAAEFIRQEAFEVSKFTGTTSVTVPIYNVKSGDIEFPIRANYNTVGIKVNQEASWVGLGWDLNTGGVITRVINGKSDFNEGDGTGRLYTKAFPDIIKSFSGKYVNNTCSEPTLFSYLKDAYTGLTDTEPDFFYFNIGDISGKFILPHYKNTLEGKFDNENEKPIVYANIDVDISLFKEGDFFRFEIKDVNGTVYYFGTTEKSMSLSYRSLPNLNNLLYNKDNKDLWKKYPALEEFPPLFNTSTWHLDSIISVKRDIVKFKYSNPSFVYTPSDVNFNLIRTTTTNHNNTGKGVEKIPGNGNHSVTYSGAVNQTRYLEQIIFKNNSVDFFTDYRRDLEEAGDYLEGTTTDPSRLIKIQVKNNKNIIKEIDFKQSYFNHRKESNFFDPNLIRLRLDSIIIRDKNNSIRQPYVFMYYPGTLPNKESLSKDYWGYYNGRNNRNLLPKKGFKGEDYNFEEGANRNTSLKHLKIGVLNKVVYPTKGTISFDYEGNVIEQKNIIKPTDYHKLELKNYKDRKIYRKAYAFYSSHDSIPVPWYVQLKLNNYPKSEDDYDNLCSYEDDYDGIHDPLYSYVFHASDSELLEDLNIPTGFFPINDTLIDISNEKTFSTIGRLSLYEYYSSDQNKEQELLKDIVPNLNKSICERKYSSEGITIGGEKSVFVKKGWNVFLARIPEQLHFLQADFDIEIKLPTEYKNDIYRRYGPGLRLKKQTLNRLNNVEVTNYKYENVLRPISKFNSEELCSPEGILLSIPRYHSKYKVKMEDTSGVSEIYYHEISSNNIGNGGSIENMDIVGYGKVSVEKNDSGIGKSIYYYYVDNSIVLYNIPLNSFPSYNIVPQDVHEKKGLLLKEEYRDSLNELVKKKEFFYKSFKRGNIDGVKLFNRDNILPKLYPSYDDPFGESGSNVVGSIYLEDYKDSPCGKDIIWGYGGLSNHTSTAFYFNHYKLNSIVSLLSKTVEKTFASNKIETSQEIVTEYEYDKKHLLPIKTTNYLLNGRQSLQKNIVYTKYPFMYNLNSNDIISKMNSRDYYQIGVPVETQQWQEKQDGTLKLISGSYTEFNNSGLPETIYSIQPKKITTIPTPVLPETEAVFKSKKTSGWIYDEELKLQYDYGFFDFGINDNINIASVQKFSMPATKYYWGYTNSYPTIKINNITDEEDGELLNYFLNIEGRGQIRYSMLPLGYDTLESLLLSLDNIATDASQRVRWNTFNNNLRNALPNAMIETYTYAPLIGMTSKTDARGYTVYYEYDGLNRLKHVKDADGNILNKNDYNYKN